MGEGVEDAGDQRAEAVGPQAAREVVGVIGRSVISPSARNMPSDSTMTTTMTTHIVAMATGSKVGRPNWKG